MAWQLQVMILILHFLCFVKISLGVDVNPIQRWVLGLAICSPSYSTWLVEGFLPLHRMTTRNLTS